MHECGAPIFRSSDGVLAAREAGRGAALWVSKSALVGFLSWCAAIGVDLLVLPQDQLFSKQLLVAAASYDWQTP